MSKLDEAIIQAIGKDKLEEAYLQGKIDGVEEFAYCLRMNYEKGMKLSVDNCENDIEKHNIKAIYSKFIKIIDDCCVKALKHLKGENNE